MSWSCAEGKAKLVGPWGCGRRVQDFSQPSWLWVWMEDSPEQLLLWPPSHHLSRGCFTWLLSWFGCGLVAMATMFDLRKTQPIMHFTTVHNHTPPEAYQGVPRPFEPETCSPICVPQVTKPCLPKSPALPWPQRAPTQHPRPSWPQLRLWLSHPRVATFAKPPKPPVPPAAPEPAPWPLAWQV